MAPASIPTASELPLPKFLPPMSPPSLPSHSFSFERHIDAIPSESIAREGKIPNIAYRAISQEMLRSMPNFLALPCPFESDLIVESSGLTWRYVRQDSQLWYVLHHCSMLSARFMSSMLSE